MVGSRLRFRFQTPYAGGGADPAQAEGALLAMAVEKLFSSAHYRPPMLPDVALRVLELSRAPDVSFASIVDLVESDPMFAMSVLKLASSPVYASRTPPRTIQQALLRLGLQTMTDICLQAALTARVFRAPGQDTAMRQLREHSIGLAHVSRLVSERSSAPAETAFTVGLLQEVGVSAGIVALGTAALWPAKAQPAVDWSVLLAVRPQLTERLVSAWRLPLELAAQLGGSQARCTDTGRATLVIAKDITATLGYGLPGERVKAESVDEARSMLGLTFSELQTVGQEARRLVAKAL